MNDLKKKKKEQCGKSESGTMSVSSHRVRGGVPSPKHMSRRERGRAHGRAGAEEGRRGQRQNKTTIPSWDPARTSCLHEHGKQKGVHTHTVYSTGVRSEPWGLANAKLEGWKWTTPAFAWNVRTLWRIQGELRLHRQHGPNPAKSNDLHVTSLILRETGLTRYGPAWGGV